MTKEQIELIEKLYLSIQNEATPKMETNLKRLHKKTIDFYNYCFEKYGYNNKIPMPELIKLKHEFKLSDVSGIFNEWKKRGLCSIFKKANGIRIEHIILHNAGKISNNINAKIPNLF
jgi:hypothetical protein